MKPWTQDVVPAAGVAMLPLGAGIAWRVDFWGGVAFAALGVTLLLGLALLDYLKARHEDDGRGKRLAEVEATLATLTPKVDKASKDAEAALGATRVNTPRASGLGF